TALLIIHSQYGYRDIAAWGDGASNPGYESNVSNLIAKFRSIFAATPQGERPIIIHVQFKTVWTDSPLFTGKPNGPPTPPKPDDPPRPPSDEILMTSHGHSVFINTPLEFLLNKKGIKTLLIAGIPTDYAVSTAVRSAQNLALTGKWGGRGNMEDNNEGDNGELAVDMPRIILVHDATRAFGKGGVDAETVHRVHVESLKEFAEVRSAHEVISALGQ
ncbi:uncharacterized protein TRIVIDRAFT_8175, partial [Trichoderma virens Gv29-8]